MANSPIAPRPPDPWPEAGHCAVASSLFCFEGDPHGLRHPFQKAKLLVTFKSVCMGLTCLARAGTFSCVPSLPGWSFLRFIYGGVLSPPADPLAFAWGQGLPP